MLRSFSLAVLALGAKGRWLNERMAEQARNHLVAVNDTLFRIPFGPDKTLGLVRNVHKRYQDEDREDIFEEVIGDGTLWVVLAAAISQTNWEGSSGWIERAILLRDLANCSELTSVCSAPRLGFLLSRFPIEELQSFVRQETPRVVGLIEKVEGLIRTKFDVLVENQAGRHHRSGDQLLARSSNTGWGKALENGEISENENVNIHLHYKAYVVPVKTQGYCVNLRIATSQLPELARLVEELQAAHVDPGAAEAD